MSHTYYVNIVLKNLELGEPLQRFFIKTFCSLHLQGTRTIIDSLDCGIEVTPVITSYAGVVDCIRTTIDEEGFSGLYKGFGALILQYGLQILLIRMVKIVLEKSPFGQTDPVSANPDKKSTVAPPVTTTLTQSQSEPGSMSTPYDITVKRPSSRQYQRYNTHFY